MGIEISIKAGADAATSSVSASGSVQHIITDKERKTFGIEDSGLKSAVEKYFGKKPNDAYLHSPTPWDDLYKTYGWSEVQTILDVKSAKITEITSEPVIVATKKFVNSSSKKATFDASISDQVTNTTESNWSQTDTIDVGQKITYDVSFLGAGGGGETSMSYSHSWGQGGSESKSITVGSSSGVSVELEPGESIEAVLSASRGVMKVRIVYMKMDADGHIVGQLAENYSVSENNTRWTFYLRDDLYWSDGEKVTPEDVEFSIRYYGEKTPWASWINDTLENSTVSDADNSVTFKFNKPYNRVSMEFATYDILPAHAVMNLLPPESRVKGNIEFRRKNLLGMNEKEMAKIRGKEIAIIFQNPALALNPVYSIGHQLAEPLYVHQKEKKKTALSRAALALKRMGFANFAECMIKKADLNGKWQSKQSETLKNPDGTVMYIKREAVFSEDSCLLKNLFEVLKDAGCRKVFLVTNPRNKVAISFYKNLGFTEYETDQTMNLNGLKVARDYSGPGNHRVVFFKMV